MSTDSKVTPTPHLKVFHAPKEQSDFSSVPLEAWSLRAIYRRYVAPTLIDRAEKTREAYLTALSHWERLTCDPPVSVINSETLLNFQLDMKCELKRNGERRSSATVNKNLRVLHPLITLLMPPDVHNPDGLGIIPYLRFPRALAQPEQIPRVLTHAELDRLYENASVVRWPSEEATGIKADLFWKTIIVALRNCGPRVYDLFELNSDSISFECEDWPSFNLGWIRFRANKTGKLQRIPINAVTMAHFKAILRGTSRVFPSCFSYSNKSRVLEHFRNIIDAARFIDPIVMNDLRKTCNTHYRRLGKPDVGDFILGHSSRGVNARNYYDPTLDVLEAVRDLPQPQSFIDGAKKLAPELF